MNIFVIILMIFAAVGFIDRAIGGRLGFEKEIETGLSTMGTLSVYIIGIYCLGTTFVQNNADAIAEATGILPVDPSIIIGCILAPDLGGQPIAMGLTPDKAMGYYSGIIVGGCLGQFISFQLPVIFSMLDLDIKQKMIRGFVYGIIAIPFGLVAGGLVMAIPLSKLFLNISIITAVCILLLAGFKRFPSVTEKILLGFSSIIESICQVLFVIVVAGIFIPKISVVPIDIILDALYLILRMTIIICGGLVISKLITKIFDRALKQIGYWFGTDKLSIVGLMLNMINTLTVVPHLKDMDANGKIINGAFAVSGSYILGGQLAFVLLVAPSGVFSAYIVSKLTAGIIGIIIAVAVSKRKKSMDLTI